MYLKKRKRQPQPQKFKTEYTPAPKVLESSYQFDLVKLLFQNKKFLQKISLYLDPEKHFDYEHLQVLSRGIIDHYNLYSASPSERVLKDLIDNGLITGEIEERMSLSAREFLTEIHNPIQDERYVIDLIGRWLEYQSIATLFERSLTALEKADMDTVKKELVGALSVSVNFGLQSESYVEETEAALERRKNSYRDAVTAGLPVEQFTQHGGMEKQNICVVLAATNVGKTAALVHIGASAVKAGYKVAHIVLESPKAELRLRYDAAFTDIPLHMIPDNDWVVRKTAQEMKEKFGDPLHYERFSPGSLTCLKVRAWLDELISSGNRPDVLIIDSADDMIPDRNVTGKAYEDLDKVYLGLLNLAEAYNVVLWTSSQGNRDALEAETVTLRMMGDSLKKAQRASFVVALCQTFQESMTSPPSGRLFVAKNRWGRKNIIEKVAYRWDRQRIEALNVPTDP